MRIFFSAGEASGDSYAAELAARMSYLHPQLQGIVGPRGQRAGIVPVADNRRWGAIGILESLLVAPRVWRGYRTAALALGEGAPGLFVAIDFGFINVKLCQLAKTKGWKTLYFVPPGSWRREKQGQDLPRIADEIVTPFEWSAEILNQMGGRAHWFGHPLKQMVRDRIPHGLSRDEIAVLPGSRIHEIQHNLPVIARALAGMERPIALSCAANVEESELRAQWESMSDLPVRIERDVYRVLAGARAAVVCSGTATLEAVLCGCPLVVVYRGSKWMELEARLRGVRPKYIALPNILLDRGVLSELIQREATPAAIRTEIDELVSDSDHRRAQLAAFEEIIDLLGPADCLDRTAELMGSMLRGGPGIGEPGGDTDG